MPENVTKISVNLPDGTIEQLKKLAEMRQVSMTQALRDAIALNSLVANEVADNKKSLFLEEEGSSIRDRIVIPS